MNPFRSLREYEEFLYTITKRFPSVQGSTLIVVHRGRRTATVQGEIAFEQGYRITVRERLSFDAGPVTIEDYGYELWQYLGKMFWYDSQPHPRDQTLASTHPHHKHIAPDLKHHRVPAPEMSFSQPNVPALICEIERLLKKTL